MTEPLYRVCWRRYYEPLKSTPLDIQLFRASNDAAISISDATEITRRWRQGDYQGVHSCADYWLEPI